MTLNRSFSNLLAAAAFTTLLAAPALAAEPIKIGVPVGLSGANSVVAPSVVQSAQLAVEEINAKGGVLGRQLALEVADDASGAAGAQKAFDSLVFQKKVDVLISMETSAARNAALPIVARGKVPYIYTSFYEGKSCSPFMFVNAWVPEQQVPPIVDYFNKEKGAKKFFLIGSDYAFGRGMLAFTRAYIEKNRRQGGRRGISADGRQRLDVDHLETEERGAGCADYIDGRRSAERHSDQATSRRRRRAALWQPRGRRGHRQGHGDRRRRHLPFGLLCDGDR